MCVCVCVGGGWCCHVVLSRFSGRVVCVMVCVCVSLCRERENNFSLVFVCVCLCVSVCLFVLRCVTKREKLSVCVCVCVCPGLCVCQGTCMILSWLMADSDCSCPVWWYSPVQLWITMYKRLTSRLWHGLDLLKACDYSCPECWPSHDLLLTCQRTCGIDLLQTENVLVLSDDLLIYAKFLQQKRDGLTTNHHWYSLT